MIVKNLVPWSGSRFSYAVGDLIDMPDDVAQARIAAGLAVSPDAESEKPVVHVHGDDPAPEADGKQPKKPRKAKE